jgi:hypothetical protein
MKTILAGVFLSTLLAICGAAIAAAADVDPVVGTWKLDVAKSTFSPGPALKSQTRIYSQSAQGLTLTQKTVTADGKEQTTTLTSYHADGKDYPVTGGTDFDTVNGKQIDTNTAEFALKKAGKAVGTTRRTVSKEGKTLTVSTDMTDAKGVKSKDVVVYDRQ